MVATLGAYQAALSYSAPPRTVSSDLSAGNRAATTTTGTPAKAGAASDVVTLSPQAQSILTSSANLPADNFAAFFAGRDVKEPPNALSNGVTASQTEIDRAAGAGKLSFDEVARRARASMDAKYAEMKEGGKPFDFDSYEGKDWYTLMGDLDRRALYAVRSNEGGQFTQQEQDIAQSIMGQQQGLAMGLYSGPSSKAGRFVDPFAGDHAAQAKAGVRFLDTVSDEEKSSIEWAAARASAQTSYEWIMEDEGKTPENLDSGDPMVNLIMAAMATMKHDLARGFTTGPLENAEDLLRQPWFEGFEDQLAQVLANEEERRTTRDEPASP